MEKPKLIISACLFGYPVRFNGGAKPLPAAQLQKLGKHYDLIPVCPECQGGLPVPRAAAEITGGSGADVLSGKARVLTSSGEDATEEFIAGAKVVLNEALTLQVKYALLKSNSPSCAAHQHYDGSFGGKLREGQGVTAALLQQNGIRVINEDDF
jgi:uncharacterized protein YbbK (DUF523 family)